MGILGYRAWGGLLILIIPYYSARFSNRPFDNLTFVELIHNGLCETDSRSFEHRLASSTTQLAEVCYNMYQQAIKVNE